MCLGVCYSTAGRIIITHFTDPTAKLPVYTKQGIQLVPWGRHKTETGNLPFGGWLTENDLKEGKWDRFFPKRIKIMVDKFSQQDFEGLQRWFDVTPGQALEGIYLQDR